MAAGCPEFPWCAEPGAGKEEQENSAGMILRHESIQDRVVPSPEALVVEADAVLKDRFIVDIDGLVEQQQVATSVSVTSVDVAFEKLMERVPKWIKQEMTRKGVLARQRCNGDTTELLLHKSIASKADVVHREGTQRALSKSKTGFQSAHLRVMDVAKLKTTAVGYVETLASGACACALTFYFNHDLKMFSVLASSMVGVICHSLPSPYREVAFAGTFGGMGGHLNSAGGPFTLGSAAVLGAVIGVVYLLMETIFNGVGGKLGTIAFISGVICAAIGKPLGNEWKPLQDPEWKGWTFPMAVEAIISGTLGCLVTVILLNKGKPAASTTLASATTGLMSILLLQLDDEPMYGKMWSAFAYTGSFAGMTAKTRLMPPFVVLAGFLGSCILLAVWPLCPGVGGKYGLSALAAVLIVEWIPGSQDPKYDPKDWFKSKSTVRKPTVSANTLDDNPEVRQGNFLGLLQQLEARRRRPDWVDWVPPRAWLAVTDFLQARSLQLKEIQGTESPSSKTVSETRLAQRALTKHYGIQAPRVKPGHVEKVRNLLDLCAFAERRIAPPPDSHAGGESDPTAVFASMWFSAAAQGNSKLSSKEALYLLEGIDAQGIGLDEDLEIGDFARIVTERRVRREKVKEVEDHIHGGFYS